MKKISFAIAGAAALALGACTAGDDAAEEAVEDQGEIQADALEDQADMATTEAEEDMLEEQADAVEDAADDRGDAIDASDLGTEDNTADVDGM